MGHHPDVEVGHQDEDPSAFAPSPETHVIEPAAVTQRHSAVFVDPVLAHPTVGRDFQFGPRGNGFGPGGEGLGRGLAAKGPVGSLVVVVLPEAVELNLELGHRARARLLGQILLQGLVKANLLGFPITVSHSEIRERLVFNP